MIPLSRERLSPKKGGYMGVALKKTDFWAENGPKMQFVGPKSIFRRHHPNFLMPSWRDTKKATFLC